MTKENIDVQKGFYTFREMISTPLTRNKENIVNKFGQSKTHLIKSLLKSLRNVCCMQDIVRAARSCSHPSLLRPADDNEHDKPRIIVNPLNKIQIVSQPPSCRTPYCCTEQCCGCYKLKIYDFHRINQAQAPTGLVFSQNYHRPTTQYQDDSST